MNFIELPLEIIYEICQKVDNQTLLNISRTNSLTKEICQLMLDKRRKEAAYDLIKNLVGNWIIIRTGGGTKYEPRKITINDTVNEIEILYSIDLIIDGMVGGSFNFYGPSKPDFWKIKILKSDIRKIERLHKNLINNGYIKKDELPIGTELTRYIIIDDSLYGQFYLRESNRYELLAIIQRLSINITGKESNFQLEEMIIQQLKNIGRFFAAVPDKPIVLEPIS